MILTRQGAVNLLNCRIAEKIELTMTHFRMERDTSHELNEHHCPGDKANVKKTG